MFARILGLVGGIPHSLLIKAAVLLFACSISYIVGNHHATVRALEAELQASADRQRENHAELIAWYADKMKELRLAREQQVDADAAAYQIMQMGKTTAEQSARTARAALAKALEMNDVKSVNSILVDPQPSGGATDNPSAGCILNPGVRQSINDYIARINATPGVGNPEAETTPVTDSPPAPDTVLACSDLAASVMDILEVANFLLVKDVSWNEWANRALK